MPARVKRHERPAFDMSNPPKAVSPLQAAALLGLSDTSYYRYVHPAVVQGEILSVTIGRQRRILTGSLLSWFEAQAQRGAWQ
jgi:hypothetical protein